MSETIFEGRYFSIHLDPTGVEFIQTGNEVLVVPLTNDNQVLLIREPSAAFGESTLILPGGEVESDEAQAETANREFQEEIGYRAGRLDFLGELRPYPKYLAVRSFVYLAGDLVPGGWPATRFMPLL